MNGSLKVDCITDVHSADVLLGRGSGPNDHIGNIRFREMVAERKAEYLATNHRQTKARIAKEIVDHVHSNNGRFLRKLEADDARANGFPDGVDAWVVASDDTAMEKAKQALRQQSTKSKGSGDQSAKQATTVHVSTEAAAAHINLVGYDDLEPIPITSTEYSMPPPPIQPIAISSGGQWMNAEPSAAALANQSGHQRTDSYPATTLVTQQAGQQGHQRAESSPPALAPQAGRQHYMQAKMYDKTGGMVAQLRPDAQQIMPSQAASVSVPSTTAAVMSNRAATVSVQPGEVRSSNPSDVSMAQIPIEEIPDHHNRRANMVMNRAGSLTMNDLAKVHYSRGQRGYQNQASEDMMMSSLADSFGKLKAIDEQKNMAASTDTMGTIEAIGAGSLADMSLASINSSTFSLFKGNESMVGTSVDKFSPGTSSGDRSDLTHDGDQHEITKPALGRDISGASTNMSMSGLTSGGSRRSSTMSSLPSGASRRLSSESIISVGDLSRGKRVNTNTTPSSTCGPDTAGAVAAGTSVATTEFMTAGIPEVTEHESSAEVEASRTMDAQPRPIGQMKAQPDDLNLEAMGSSSMSILKAAFTSVNEFELPEDYSSSHSSSQHRGIE